MAEHIVAIFSTESAAAAAALDLENAGFSASAIRRYSPNTEGVSSDTSVSRTTELTSSGGGGFWAWLLGEEPSVETTRARYPRDEEIYERRAHAGETILSVTVYDDDPNRPCTYDTPFTPSTRDRRKRAGDGSGIWDCRHADNGVGS